MKKSVWTLSKRSGRRFQRGHPWVFANELSESPKGHVPGSIVELRSAEGEFLAYGYGNTNSLIVFRSLARSVQGHLPWSESALLQKALRACALRTKLGLREQSCRLIYGEADELPGLVMDRFTDGQKQVLVMQILTAGMEVLLPSPESWVRSWVKEGTGMDWAETTLIVRRDVKNRQMEGLKLEDPQVYNQSADANLKRFSFRVGSVELLADLISGQKTGFFFDQVHNIELVKNILDRVVPTWPAAVSVMDICCYLGQWGTQLAHHLRQRERRVTVNLVDSSATALELAKINVEKYGAKGNIFCLDVMEGLKTVPESHIVICDPPAFVKAKKDLEAGLKGYVKVNAMAMERLAENGLYVACSCSQHVSDADFSDCLMRAASRAERRIQWLVRGGQSPDHPVLAGFPEGQYLKCWIGIAN